MSVGTYETQFQSLLRKFPLEFALSEHALSEQTQSKSNQRVMVDARVAPRFDCSGNIIVRCVKSAPALQCDMPIHCVIIRNVSTSGISFYSNRQFFPGQDYDLYMPTAKAAARIVRCRYLVELSCFEIGARFVSYAAANAIEQS
jgi:hypothetical protein